MTDPCQGIAQSEICRLKAQACDQRFDALQRLFLATAEDQDRAIDLAREHLKDKLHEVNQAREKLDEQARNFVGYPIYSVQHKDLQNKIDSLNIKVDFLINSNSEQRGRSDRNQLYSIVSIIIAIGAVAAHFWGR